MVIPADLSAKILRLYKAERWRVGTIARQLHVHRDTVRRVLAQAGEPAPGSPLRPSRVDAYRAFILQTLAKFPTLTAARLFAMVHERGYRGSPEHFRHVIAGIRRTNTENCTFERLSSDQGPGHGTVLAAPSCATALARPSTQAPQRGMNLGIWEKRMPTC